MTSSIPTGAVAAIEPSKRRRIQAKTANVPNVPNVPNVRQLCCAVVALHQVKAGNAACDFEDAFAFGPSLSYPHPDVALAHSDATFIGGARAHVAVADGATESSFSGMWATMLVRAYRKGEMQSTTALRKRVDSLAQRWLHSLNFRKLPWYAEEKARMGAFSTLLGLTIMPSVEPQGEGGTWQATAIGDSCLFHIRNDALIQSLPVLHSSEFDNSPALLSSVGANNATLWNSVAPCEGRWKLNDIFLLATDALARWLLAQNERGHHPWSEVIRIAQSGARARDTFTAWVAECRANWGMKNDDVSCLVVQMKTSESDETSDVSR